MQTSYLCEWHRAPGIRHERAFLWMGNQTSKGLPISKWPIRPQDAHDSKRVAGDLIAYKDAMGVGDGLPASQSPSETQQYDKAPLRQYVFCDTYLAGGPSPL